MEKFWRVVEANLSGYNIPTFIKNGFNDCGYGNPLSFKSILEEDIDFVEKKIKEKGEKLVHKLRNDDNNSSDEEGDYSMVLNDPIDTFGEMYAKHPNKFQFRRGERNLIKIIVTHVQSLVDDGGENKGLAKFKEKKSKKNQRKIQNSKENSSDSKPSNDELNKVLFNKVINCLTLYNVDVSDCENSMVSVDSSGAYGNIKCILCGDDNTKRVTYYQPANRTSFWVLSNFTSHLEKKHKLVAQSKPQKKQRKMKSHTTSNLNSQKYSDDGGLLESASTLNEIVSTDTKYVSLLDKTMDTKHRNDSYTIEIVDVKIKQPSLQPEDISNSDLYVQMAEQIRGMVTSQLINSEKTEQMEITFGIGMEFSIYIMKIVGDGNCLFTSLAHQLWPNAIASVECKNNAIKLRADVVEHILANIDLYQMFIEDRVEEMKSLSCDDASLKTKCQMWVRHVLSRQGIWGGMETIKAVSRMFRVNVVTFIECGKCELITAAELCEQRYDRTISIAYRCHLNDINERVYDHYDSVCDMESNAIYAASEYIINK